MSSLRQTAAAKAGPAALGILTPPGRRTFLILRPRGLDWDLVLLAAPGGDTFRTLTREEAAAGARAVFRTLEAWAAGGPGAVEPVACDDGFRLGAAIGEFTFLACPRVPGRPYQPLVCPDLDGAREAARALVDALRPPAGGEREVYFNTSHFSR